MAHTCREACIPIGSHRRCEESDYCPISSIGDEGLHYHGVHFFFFFSFFFFFFFFFICENRLVLPRFVSLYSFVLHRTILFSLSHSLTFTSPHPLLTHIHTSYIHTYIYHLTSLHLHHDSLSLHHPHTLTHSLSLSRVCVCGEQQQQAPSHREDCTNTYTYILNQRERERECVCVRTQRIHQKRRLSTIQDVMSMST